MRPRLSLLTACLILATVSLVSAAPEAAPAPAPPGSIAGTVLDGAGSPVQDALVLLCDPATGMPFDPLTWRPISLCGPGQPGAAEALTWTRTDESGGFAFEGLPPGIYRLVSQHMPGLQGLMEKASAPVCVVDLYGSQDNVAVAAGERTVVQLQPAGPCTVRIRPRPPLGALVLSTEQPRHDPILGAEGLGSSFWAHAVGFAVTIDTPELVIRGLPEGRIYIAGGFGYEAFPPAWDAVQLSAAADVSVDLVATYRWDKRRPLPKHLAALERRLAESGTDVTDLLGPLDPGAHFLADLAPVIERVGPLDHEVALPDGSTAPVADLLAVHLYRKLGAFHRAQDVAAGGQNSYGLRADTAGVAPGE